MRTKIFLLLLSSLTLWADGWIVDKNNSNKITYGYSREGNTSLSTALSKMKEAFSIRILLSDDNNEIQDGLKKYYEEKMAKKLKKAIDGSQHFHSPSIKPLREVFPDAFKSTAFYKKLKKELFKKGYVLDVEISFEKFHLYNSKNSYAFYADIWQKAIPFSDIWSSFLESVERKEFKDEKLLIFSADFMKKLRENETFYHKIDNNSSLDFEVIVTTTQPNEIAKGHEGGQHTFYFKDTLEGYKFSGIDTIP